MNKKLSQGVVVGAFALFLALMVGYALFSQNLKITGTAKAQGDFKITPTCTPGVTTELQNNQNLFVGTQADFTSETEGGYDTSTCTIDGDTINFATNFKSIGRRYYTMEFENTGSISAKWSLTEKGMTYGEEKLCSDGYDGEAFDDNFSDKECSLDTSDSILTVDPAREPFLIRKTDGSFEKLDNNSSRIISTEDDTYVILEPGEKLVFLANTSMYNSTSVPSWFNQKQFNIKHTWNLTLHFEQAS